MSEFFVNFEVQNIPGYAKNAECTISLQVIDTQNKKKGYWSQLAISYAYRTFAMGPICFSFLGSYNSMFYCIDLMF